MHAYNEPHGALTIYKSIRCAAEMLIKHDAKPNAL